MPSPTVHQWAYDLAKKQIDINGRHMELVYSRPVDSATARPGESASVDVVIPVVGLQTKFEKDERDLWGVSDKDKAIMFDTDIEPHEGWIVRESNGDETTIKNIRALTPGMTSVLYKVQAVA